MPKNKSQEKLGNTLNRMKMKITPYRNMLATAKAVLRGKFIALNTYIRKHVSSQINLTFQLKK